MSLQLHAPKFGWLRVLIFLILIILSAITLQAPLSTLVDLVTGNSQKEDSFSATLKMFLLYTTITIVFMLIVGVMRKFVDRKSFRSLGFEWKGFQSDGVMGFFAAIAMLSIGTLILIAAGYLQLNLSQVDFYTLSINFVLMIIVAVSEEILFRGYIMNNLLPSLNKWVVLVISAIIFGLFHGGNPGAGYLAIFNVFAAGLLLGINYIYTKNLWFGILFHFAWNFVQGAVLGFEVSGTTSASIFEQNLSGPDLYTGGPFGFEASLICTILLLVATFIFAWLFYRKYQQQPALLA